MVEKTRFAQVEEMIKEILTSLQIDEKNYGNLSLFLTFFYLLSLDEQWAIVNKIPKDYHGNILFLGIMEHYAMRENIFRNFLEHPYK